MRNLNFLNSNNQNHKSLRVRTNIGDTYLSVNLDQTYESLDILSLKIYQRDVYRLFDADYSIIVGRVTAQDIGIPNCRISVFVPTNEDTIIGPTQLDDIKKIEAATIYPFKTVFDKDGYGKIYNLLPRYSRNRGLNGFSANEFGIGSTPKTPVGTFPEKEEILTNETLAYVYDKYYKYSTITNESGDYILVVPSNRTYTVNMSCDITDIGRFSTTAALLKAEGGFPDNYFSEDGLTVNPEIPLERLPNIDIQNQTIYVKPLWSQNPDNGNVGINRLDFKLQKKIQPYVTVIGNYFTQNPDHRWENNQDNDGGRTDPNHIKIPSHLKGSLELQIFTLKNTVSESDAELLNNLTTITTLNNYDINSDILLLDNSKYQFYQNDGNAIITINCNRNKVITNEFGEIISVADDNEAGAFTSFRGYFWVENTERVSNPDSQTRGAKIKLRVPLREKDNRYYIGSSNYEDVWRHYKFDYGEIYGWTQKNEVRNNSIGPADERLENQTNILYFGKIFQTPGTDPSLALIPNANNGSFEELGNAPFPNGYSDYRMYKNFYNHIKCVYGIGDITRFVALKNQWMNFSLYFINFLYNTSLSVGTRQVDFYITTSGDLIDNQQPLGANEINSKWVANGQFINTDFFKVNKEDLLKFFTYEIEGIRQLGFKIPKAELKGEYPRYNNSNYGPGFNNNNQTPSYINQDSGDAVGECYFLVGQIWNDALRYLVESRII
jgi:hypothetical protein